MFLPGVRQDRLGDSYSSAAGVAPQVIGAPATCSRSQLNYAEDIAARTHPVAFTDRRER